MSTNLSPAESNTFFASVASFQVGWNVVERDGSLLTVTAVETLPRGMVRLSLKGGMVRGICLTKRGTVQIMGSL